MRVFVLVALRSTSSAPFPPSIWHLQHTVRMRFSRSFRATTAAFLWTRDALFDALRRVPPELYLSEVQKPDASNAPVYAFYTALLDVGGNEEDVEVVAMLLHDLCQAWPGAAAHVEICRPSSGFHPASSAMSTQHEEEQTQAPNNANAAGLKRTSSFPLGLEREETLLVMLADAIEATAQSQDAYLRRWGVDAAWDYTQDLPGRSWFVESGHVAVLPREVCRVVDCFLQLELDRLLCRPASGQLERCEVETVLGAALGCAVLEKDLTQHLRQLFATQTVPQRLYAEAAHTAVVAVPPAVAVFLSALPSTLLHDCVLFHGLDSPLSPFMASVVHARTSALQYYGNEEEAPVVVPASSPTRFLQHSASQSAKQAMCGTPAERRFEVAETESQRLADLFRDYDILLASSGAVRVPLPPLSRYVFGVLVCQCELPSVLMAPFIRRHAGVTIGSGRTHAGGADTTATRHREVPTEEEIVLGMRVTWAVRRWSAALRAHTPDHTSRAVPRTCDLPFWYDAPALHVSGCATWVHQRMQAAQQRVARLADGSSPSITQGAETSSNMQSSSALADFATTLRATALASLEQQLFAPRITSFRGSSTAWLAEAVQNVSRQYAQIPSSLMNEAAGSGERQAEEAFAIRELQENVPAHHHHVFSTETDRVSSSSGYELSEPTSRSSSLFLDSDDDSGGPDALLDEMEELQSELERVMQVSANGTAQEARAGDKIHSPTHEGEAAAGRLSANDISAVAHNELFLHHVHLFAEETELDSRGAAAP